MLQKFLGGSPAVRNKLNAIVDEVNPLTAIRGDRQFIGVDRGPGGCMVSLNIAAVLSRVPRIPHDWFLFAKLTSQDATNKWWYAWSEAQPTSGGWALKSGGRSGTSSGGSADPAMWTDDSETTDLSGLPQPYVLLVRSQSNSSGQSGWVIVSPIGVCTTADVPGYVHWDGVNNRWTQDTTSNTWTQGLLVHISSTTTVNITDTSNC